MSAVSEGADISGAGFDTATAGGSGEAGAAGFIFSAGLTGAGLTGVTFADSMVEGVFIFALLRLRGRWIPETGRQRKERVGRVKSAPVWEMEVDAVTAEPPVELPGRRAADHCPERQFPAMEIKPAIKVIMMRCLIFIILSYNLALTLFGQLN